MPDITMCSGEGCPLKDDCWRHNATPNEYRQSFFVTPPYDAESNDCVYFWVSDLDNVRNKRPALRS